MPTPPNDEDHVNDQMFYIGEAADYLSVSFGTMRYWRHRGTGPKIFKVGGRVRYWRSELIRWLADQSRRPVPGSPQPALS